MVSSVSSVWRHRRFASLDGGHCARGLVPFYDKRVGCRSRPGTREGGAAVLDLNEGADDCPSPPAG
jgi:hypothetical protein